MVSKIRQPLAKCPKMDGVALRRARDKMDVSQSELGRWLGSDGRFPQRNVRNWEKDVTPVPGSVARAVTLELENRKLRAKLAEMS